MEGSIWDRRHLQWVGDTYWARVNRLARWMNGQVGGRWVNGEGRQWWHIGAAAVACNRVGGK